MVVSIYLFLFILGFVIVMVLASMGFVGDFDTDSDVDLDVSGDFDSDVDLDIGADVDAGVDMDADADIDVGDIDADSETSHHLGGISPLSPFIISIFFTSFGGFGMIFEEQGLANYIVPILALICGLVLTAVCRYGLQFIFIKQQASTTVKAREMVGELGEVIVPIPIDGNVGTVQIITKAGRMIFSAKADYEIASREIVKVTRQVGDVLYVKKEKETLKDIIPENLPNDKSIKKREVKDGPVTIIYDQKQIEIKDSVVQRTNFGTQKKEEDK